MMRLIAAGSLAAGAVVLAVAPYGMSDYQLLTLTRILVVGLLAVSVAVMTGVCGLPTLGQTAPYAVGAYTAGLLARGEFQIGVGQLVVAALAGAAFALLTSPLVVRARGVVVLMITLALGELTMIVATRWKSVTGGTDGLVVYGSTRPLPGMPELDDEMQVYWYVLAVTGALVVAVLLALRSPAGALLRASRDDEKRMRASGHPVTGYFTAAYVFAGAIAGAAGALLVTVNEYMSPADAGFEASALVLLAVTIGGAASIVGAYAGAALVVSTRDYLAGPFPGHAPLLLGTMFVLSVYLLPDGVAGLAGKLSGKIRHRIVSKGAAS